MTGDPARFRVLVVAAALVVVIAVVYLRFGYELTVDPLPKKPTIDLSRSKEVANEAQADPRAYAQRVAKDAGEFGVNRPNVAEMSAAFTYRIDNTRHTLAPPSKRGDASSRVTAAGLELSIAVKTPGGNTMDLLQLTISNPTQRALAYRIQTVPARGKLSCVRKKHLPHNAMAVPPNSKEVRSECVYERGDRITITQVETIELPELAYVYASSLDPVQIGIDGRVARGHRPIADRNCAPEPAKTLRAIENGDVTWRDLIDFYARHPCWIYRIPLDYRAFESSGTLALPVSR